MAGHMRASLALFARLPCQRAIKSYFVIVSDISGISQGGQQKGGYHDTMEASQTGYRCPAAPDTQPSVSPAASSQRPVGSQLGGSVRFENCGTLSI